MSKQKKNKSSANNTTADTIITNAHIATMDDSKPFVSAVAIKDGIFIAIGSNEEIMAYKSDMDTDIIDANGRTIIPGLNDSHIHIIRGGLNYNMELRWDGVPSLAESIKRVREQAKRTPQPQWIRVVGGWSEFQFNDERRMPTINEIEQAADDTPAFILHLYHCSILNKAAIRAAGYNKDTPNPPDAEIERDSSGNYNNLTGLITAKPAATILYQTLAKGPKLSYDDQINSTRHFMYELNRFGVTSAIDAGGGFQNFPDDYKVIADLAKQGLLTVRIAYNLFTQRPKKELEDFTNWIKMVKPGDGDDFYRMNGAGEMLVFSAADYENTLEPRPDLAETMESELKEVVKLLVQNRWPFRIHATYDESITRFLNVFEEVNKEIPFIGLRWFLDHAETISEYNIERVHALGGGIAIQDRLAFQGEHFIERYGKEVAERSPPIRKIIEMGVPLGAGTDATRVSTYNPWVSLYWLVTGKTVGGTILRSDKNRVNRMGALRLYTIGSAWFSNEENKKGSIEVGKLADLVVLSDDYFSVPEEQIKHIESILTIVGGKVVYTDATSEFKDLAPSSLPSITPKWSPVATYGGYTNSSEVPKTYPSIPGSSSSSVKSHNSTTNLKTNTTTETQSEKIPTQYPSSNKFDQAAADIARVSNKSNKIWSSCCDEYFTF
jgi:predicted amidohydrolase YtcJ